MGMNVSTYFGMYLEATIINNQDTIDSKEKISVCPNKCKHLSKSMVFCPECGNKLKQISKTKAKVDQKIEDSIWDMEESDDLMFMVCQKQIKESIHTYWLSNTGDFFIDLETDYSIINIEDIIPIDFSKEIKILNKYYDNVVEKTGLITYWE